jgi:hypothetical protein
MAQTSGLAAQSCDLQGKAQGESTAKMLRPLSCGSFFEERITLLEDLSLRMREEAVLVLSDR